MRSFTHTAFYITVVLICTTLTVFSQGSVTQQGIRFIHPNSTTNAISLVPPSSITSYTLTLPGTQGAASSYLLNDGSGNLSWATLSSSTPLSSITAATATNSINSSNFGQTWQWNTLAGTSALTLSSTSTAAASNAQTLLNISLSGANATTTQTTYGMQVANTHTGTSSTNIAGYFSASGGTNNYGLLVASGNVGVGTTTPSQMLHVLNGNILLDNNDNTARELRFDEPSASGNNYTAFKAQAQAADVTYTLPAADGSNGQVLSTNGSGTLSWTTASGTTALSNITAATATNSINSSNFGQTWAWNTLAGTSALTLSSTSTAAASNAQTLLNITLSGANATTTQTTYGMQVANTHTGTSSTNIAGYFTASGGTNNYGLIVAGGNVGVGITTPTVSLHNISTDASTATTTVGEIIGHNSSGTPAASFGVGTKYTLESTTTADQDAAQISVLWTTATHATRTSALTFSTVTSGAALSETMRITNSQVGIGTTSITSGSSLDVKGHMALSNAGTASEVRFYEPSGSGSNYTAFKAQAQTADVTYTLPAAVPTANDYVMTATTGGTMSWTDPTRMIGGVDIIYKTTDELITNSNALQDDDHLTMPIGANEVWQYELVLFVTGNPGDIKIAMNVPSGATMKFGLQMDNDDSNDEYELLSSSGVANTTWMDVSSGDTYFVIKGIVVNSSTSGNVKLQWAQWSSNATATRVRSLSYMRGVRIQ